MLKAICWSHTFVKPILRNYKSHVKKNACSCKIATHFIDECFDKEMPFKYLAFVIIGVVNNTSGLTLNKIEELLLQKEIFRHSSNTKPRSNTTPRSK